MTPNRTRADVASAAAASIQAVSITGSRPTSRASWRSRTKTRSPASAFVLFLGVHALESYILTPIIQRQALDIPPATLFAFQILLGVVFGLWGLALALPLMAIVKVIIDFARQEDEKPQEFKVA